MGPGNINAAVFRVSLVCPIDWYKLDENNLTTLHASTTQPIRQFLEVNSPDTQIDLEDWDNKDFALGRISLAGCQVRGIKTFHLEFDRRVSQKWAK